MIDELEVYEDVVADLVDALRSPNPANLEEIVNLTRENLQ